MFIVTKTIDSENISKVCRTCLREDNDKMVYLFVGPAQSSLGAKLQSLSCLEVTQGDGLPEKMCDRCVIRAESALLFREQCRAADQALKQAAIRVSKAKAFSNIPTCKIYPQNQNYVPLPYTQGATNFADCRLFTNHQELYMHNRLYPQIYQRDENLPQHMSIVESHNAYLNLSRYNTGFTHHDLMSDKVSSIIRQDDLDSFIRHDSAHNEGSCALQCSLCNYTFNDRTQLENHSITHNSDSMDLSSDEVNIEVEDNSSELGRNINFERPIVRTVEQSLENISYDKINSDCSNGYQNLNFSNIISQNNSEIINVMDPIIIPQEMPMPNFMETSQITKNNRFKCEICSRLFSQKAKLVAHQLSHTKQKPFECVHCGKTYSSKSKLAAHGRLHTQTNIHQCNICQKIFSYPSYLSDHMKTHNPKAEKKASFQCVQCNKQFFFAKSYKRHMKFHTGKGLFHCDICDKLFSQKYSLKVHMQSHDSTRCHKCELCDKSFNQKSNLVEHMRTHTKVKPFKCKICEKSFTQSSHLKSHEVSHNSIRQFQCRLCGKRFKLASHLKRHVNLHTGLKMFKCNECNQMFSQSFSLKRHTKKHLESNL
ncbi:PREDICTED: zinc finger protein 2-like [Ceratosolen solmsi marchali]|uniref:Zinc finger protein 2-like n=1 Tax=Ceratosolen solmsi marchali TaxID=326594 RepID=A0AAJ6YG29_9HYME|nr:PREDICTED: zinc finger protein 2-like [Ceratosolen solmsi marchali]